MKEIQMDLTLYMVVNQKGQFFRAKGYGGYGESWVDNASAGRIYTKLGPARSTVTYFTKEHEKYGVPNIVEIKPSVATIMVGERERALKARAKIQKELEEREVRNRQYELELAEQRLKKAQNDLDLQRKKNKVK